jgi:hypothetical protein
MIMWRKSSHSSGGASGNCAEVAADPNGSTLIRDSKNPKAGHLSFSRRELAELAAKVKAGDLDL